MAVVSLYPRSVEVFTVAKSVYSLPRNMAVVF